GENAGSRPYLRALGGRRRGRHPSLDAGSDAAISTSARAWYGCAMVAPSPTFADVLAAHGMGPLRRASVTTLQVNVGKLCNQACHHCHVDAGPKRTEIMTARTAARVTELL